MSREGLEALSSRVHADEALVLRLRRAELAHFEAGVVRLARELAIDVTEEDVRDAIARGREAWLLRWIL